MTAYARSLIRLLLPTAAGVATALVAKVAAKLNPTLVASLTPLASYCYYAGFGWLEKKYPWASKFFLVPRPPSGLPIVSVSTSANGTVPKAK